MVFNMKVASIVAAATEVSAAVIELPVHIVNTYVSPTSIEHETFSNSLQVERGVQHRYTPKALPSYVRHRDPLAPGSHRLAALPTVFSG
jgi:hypothetical protein